MLKWVSINCYCRIEGVRYNVIMDGIIIESSSFFSNTVDSLDAKGIAGVGGGRRFKNNTIHDGILATPFDR